MKKILAKELKIKFIETLNDVDGFSYEDGNPFKIAIDEKLFHIFLKNLSPAYFKNSPDITRVQLPFSDHFAEIFKTNIPFVILGYDVENDTLACWNPSKVKDRLNAKRNVSLYSRNSLQSDITKAEFRSGFLSNGEKIILFRREDLHLFFIKLSTLFDDEPNTVTEPNIIYSTDKIYELTDTKVLNLIIPLLEKNRVLEAVELCTKYYVDKYKKMAFKDWFSLVNRIYKKMDNN